MKCELRKYLEKTHQGDKVTFVPCQREATHKTSDGIQLCAGHAEYTDGDAKPIPLSEWY